MFGKTKESTFPKRTKDKVALVAFAPTTRDLAPWDDPDYEVWILNEGYNFPWTKRFDRIFQIHPRWDCFRKDNANDPNHPYWLQNKSGPCNLCNGTGYLGAREKDIKCNQPNCKDGTYTPPADRKNVKSIFMQKQWDDIPNSVKYPLEEATKQLPLDGYAYFTSTFAFMLSLAVLMGFKKIEIYGFEMGTNTEYSFQRPNAEYLMGLFQGRGHDIYIPKESSLRKGLLYGYKNMRTGYRQQVDMRAHVNKLQLERDEKFLENLSGQLTALSLIKEQTPEVAELLKQKHADYNQMVKKVYIVKGAGLEIKNLTGLYDTYFQDNSDAELEADPDIIRRDTKTYVENTYEV